MTIKSTDHFVITDNGFVYEQQAQLSGYPQNEKEYVQKEFAALCNSPAFLEGLKTQLLIAPGGVGPGMRLLFAKWRIERMHEKGIVLTILVREFIAQVREASIDVPGLLSEPFPELTEEAAINLVNLVGLDAVTKDYLLSCVVMGDIIPEYAARAAAFKQLDHELAGILTSYFNSQNGLVEVFKRQFEQFQFDVDPNEERSKISGRHYNVTVLPYDTDLTGFSYLLSASDLVPNNFSARCITAEPDLSMMQEAIWELQEHGFDRRPEKAEEPTNPAPRVFDVEGITLLSSTVFHFVGSSKKDFVQNALAMTRDNVDPAKVVNVPESIRGKTGFGAFYFLLDKGTVIGGEFDEYNGLMYHFFVDGVNFPPQEISQPIAGEVLTDVQNAVQEMVKKTFPYIHSDNHLFILAQRF